MKIHINYAHRRFIRSQMKCCESALQNGFELTIPYGVKDLDAAFAKRNHLILKSKRGAGYWIWKPYVILKTLRSMHEDDWLMYTDSGMYFVRNPWDWILSRKDEIGEKGIATFSVCGTEREYTKRDAFILMGLDEPRYTDTDQRMAGVFACRRTPFSEAFAEEWLRYATDRNIITDLSNLQGKPNYPEFKDHRHDQSIMSLLCKKYDTFLFNEDITQFSNPNPYLISTRDPK